MNSIDLVTDRNGITNMPARWFVDNPSLGQFTSINGRPKVYPLLAGSPAIDVSDNPVSGSGPLPDDERGGVRPVDGLTGHTCGGQPCPDLGAFEYNPN